MFLFLGNLIPPLIFLPHLSIAIMPNHRPSFFDQGRRRIADRNASRSARRHSLRRLFVETLESRQLLAGDFGDAPAPYPVLAADDGAVHVATGPQLGATRDMETDGVPSANATGDGTDEDGVTFGTLRVGQTDATVTVNVRGAQSGARLDAWIDFDGDGSWSGPNEQVFQSIDVSNGNNRLTFGVPADAASGQTFARFRLSTAGNLGIGGPAANGEVEDHAVNIALVPFQVVGINAGEQTIELPGLSGGFVPEDGFGDPPTLQITATSSNPTLIADPTISFATADANATLTYTPVTGQRGTSTITLNIVDAGPDGDLATETDNVTTTRTFDIRVTPFATTLVRSDFAPVISELVLSPTFGDRDTQQLIELRGQPNTALGPNTYFVTVSEENSDRGAVREIFDLSGQSFGANGYLVLAQAGSPHAIHPDSAVLRGTTTGFNGMPGDIFSDADSRPGEIGGSLTLSTGFFFIRADTPPQLGDDIDADNDGFADFDGTSIRGGWSVLDSVSVHPFVGSGDQAYGQILLAEDDFGNDPTMRTVEPGVAIVAGGGVSYVARLGESIGSDPDDWAFGVAIDRDDDRSGDLLELFGFSTELPTPTRLLERALDHFGEANFFSGIRGTITILPAIADLDPSLPAPTPRPVVGAEVLVDSNGNGLRDTFLLRVEPDEIARPLVDPFAGPFDPTPEIPLTHAYPGVTISTAGTDNVPFNFEVRAIREFTPFFNTNNFLFSHVGINFFSDVRRLRFDFDHPVREVSIVAIGPVSTTTPSYGRIEAYNANDELIGVSISNPLFNSGRQTIGVGSTDDNIAYAVAYTDESFLDGSPFGRFDSFAYRQSEVVAVTDENGQYEVHGLVPGTYEVTVAGASDLLGSSGRSFAVTRYENFVLSSSLRPNTLPTVAPEFVFNVDENSPVGTSLGVVEASDVDEQALTFEIVGENLGGLIIDPSTGELFVGNPNGAAPGAPSLLNFEQNESLEVTVLVRDSIGASMTNVTLTLNDLNEAPVVNAVPFLVAEGTLSGTNIGQVRAVDPDTAMMQTMQYAIVGGPDQAAFQIDAATGLITLIDDAAIDFERRPELEFQVRVTDNADTPQVTEFTQVVRVIDQNDVPVITTTQLTVPENPMSPVVGQLIASDPDVGQTQTFELVGGTGRSLFAVQFDGTVVVRPGAVIDFEQRSEYSLIVRTIDSGAPPLASEAEVRIIITDVDELPTLDQSMVELSEDAAPGTVAATLTAIDPDTDAVTPVISLVPGGDSDNFTFDAGTGRLIVAEGAAFDFESAPVQSVVMQLTIPATETTPETNNNVTLTVRLRDANDAPVIMTERVVLSELAVPGTIVGPGPIQSFDPDANDTATFAIVGGNASDRFTLNPDTGVLVIAAGATFDADGSEEPLTLEIRVTDSAGLNSSRVIDVVLNGVNEPPVFTGPAPLAQSVQSGEFFELVIPADGIIDPEGSPFFVTAFDQTGRLPSFLSFDPVTRTLSGTATPRGVGTYTITIRAFEPGPLPIRTDQSFTLDVVAGDNPFTNKRDRFDVDANDQVSAIDALRIINFLSQFGSGTAVSTDRPFSGFLDVSGDGRISALDAVQVINALAARSVPPLETEQFGIDDDDRDDLQDAAMTQYLDEVTLF